MGLYDRRRWADRDLLGVSDVPVRVVGLGLVLFAVGIGWVAGIRQRRVPAAAGEEVAVDEVAAGVAGDLVAPAHPMSGPGLGAVGDGVVSRRVAPWPESTAGANGYYDVTVGFSDLVAGRSPRGTCVGPGCSKPMREWQLLVSAGFAHEKEIAMTTTAVPCPGCGRGELALMARLGRQPAVGTVIYDDPEAAREAPSASLDVGFCRRCGLVRGMTFDPTLVPYDAAYENSQHFSPRFARYARELAERLVSRHGLAGGAVVEIGSGKGEFLAELCRASVAKAYGYDASYAGEIDDNPFADRIEFVRRDYDSDARLPAAGLVCCRHVLEHFVDPAALLHSLRRSLGDSATPVYVEVPNGEFVLSPSGMWDFIYQHVSYFTDASLEVLFTRCGFEVTDLRHAFDGQFLAIEATPTGDASDDVTPQREVGPVVAKAEQFAAAHQAALIAWDKELSGRDDVVLWGAGSKGVTFLNTTAARDAVRAVVDLNPRKQGAFVAGTGQPIVAPERLVDDPPGTVLVANPAYVDEVRDHLHSLGLTPEVACI